MSCNNENQCCANTMNNKRCTNFVSFNTKHCEIHRLKAKSLYLKYKKLSKQVDILNINKQFNKQNNIININNQINYITDCYILIDKTHKARIKHNKYAFVPECSDDGHEFQLQKLCNLMDICESKLYKLIDELDTLKIQDNKQKEIKNNNTLKECTHKITDNSIIKKESIHEKIEKYRQLRIQREKDEKLCINKYIEENDMILKRREFLLYKILDCVQDLFGESGKDIHKFIQSITLFNMTKKLYSYGYFEKSFTPDRCTDPDCNCGRLVHYEASLGCHCVYKYNTPKQYFTGCTEDSLKIYYSILLLHKHKLIALIQDIITIYNEEEEKDSIFILKVHFEWNVKEKRLMLLEGSNELNLRQDIKDIKNMFASQRSKNR